MKLRRSGRSSFRLTDGRHLGVPHGDVLSRSPGGQTLIVYHGEEAFSIVDLLLVTATEVPDGKRRLPRPGH